MTDGCMRWTNQPINLRWCSSVRSRPRGQPLRYFHKLSSNCDLEELIWKIWWPGLISQPYLMFLKKRPNLFVTNDTPMTKPIVTEGSYSMTTTLLSSIMWPRTLTSIVAGLSPQLIPRHPSALPPRVVFRALSRPSLANNSSKSLNAQSSSFCAYCFHSSFSNVSCRQLF